MSQRARQNLYLLTWIVRCVSSVSAQHVSSFHANIWVLSGARQATRIREMYFRSVLRQEVAFFDASATTGALLQGLNEDTVAVQNAIGEKVGNFLHNFITFIVGITIGKQSKGPRTGSGVD